ncbi:hypothetical protein BH11BAC4_BH11BAC4_01150 [soil metagenome]
MSVVHQISVSAILPTANRSEILKQTLESIAKQEYQPAEIIIIDASDNDETARIAEIGIERLTSTLHYKKAAEKGAAVQRNEGIDLAGQSFIFFLDDDIEMEVGCIERLWNCIQSDKNIGAVNAMITNQRYHTPGKISRTMYRIMSGEKLSSYAGKCIGPAWNLLPEDGNDLPECSQVEWLNTTCTIYKKEALPDPVFTDQFQGYSLLEDVALSLKVGRKWKLYNARTARIFHNSQPGTHKNNILKLSKMELVNRHYVMTTIVQHTKFSDYCKLFLFELFGIVSMLTSVNGWKTIIPATGGKFAAVGTILFSKTNHG